MKRMDGRPLSQLTAVCICTLSPAHKPPMTSAALLPTGFLVE